MLSVKVIFNVFLFKLSYRKWGLIKRMSSVYDIKLVGNFPQFCVYSKVGSINFDLSAVSI